MNKFKSMSQAVRQLFLNQFKSAPVVDAVAQNKSMTILDRLLISSIAALIGTALMVVYAIATF